ncbi:MAG: hypothetical protein Q9225_004193 [Loekoesia sp. 1 TL-2023]
MVKVHNEIKLQLRNVVESPPSEFAKATAFEGSATFVPSDPDDYGRHDPDGSFRHPKEPFPGLVTQAGYSQQGKTLRDLADDYILGSDLRVRAMAAFDLSSKEKGKTATLSVWRPRRRQEDDGEVWITSCEVQVFRDASGEPNLDPDCGLRLHLRDFAGVESCETFDNIEGTIFISCASLCDFLNDAESPVPQPTITERPVLRKRRHTPSPEEQLNTR